MTSFFWKGYGTVTTVSEDTTNTETATTTSGKSPFPRFRRPKNGCHRLNEVFGRQQPYKRRPVWRIKKLVTIITTKTV